MTLATRHRVAKRQSSSMLTRLAHQTSCSASVATSRPILLRNLKQSATTIGGRLLPVTTSAYLLDILHLDRQ